MNTVSFGKLTDKPQKKTLFIVRGVPGSGKTTFVKNFLKGVFHVENDMFHMKGLNYEWSADGQKKAIDFCSDFVEYAMEHGIVCAVSNTFTRKRFVDYYVDMAKRYGYTVFIFRCMGEFTNVHSVPYETLKSMSDGFEDYEGEIIVRPCDNNYMFSYSSVDTETEM